MSVRIQFLGASGTVTGSKYLVEGDGKRILIDVGLFQGPREWREKNWVAPPVKPASIDAVLLTHAHIDHIGMLPRFVRLGLKCPVYATPATAALARILLPDSGQLQEEEAKYRIKYHRSRHEKPEPLYTKAEAIESLRLFQERPFHKRIEILPGIFATWKVMGHILGAASITLEIAGKTINFSGDIGRYGVPILKDPEPMVLGDLLLMESTYGDREHGEEDPKGKLADVIVETAKRGGVVIIPSFAVGRAQTLLYYLRELQEEKRIPMIPIVIDSPMASDATEIYRQFPECYDEQAVQIQGGRRHPFSPMNLGFVGDREESKRLNNVHEPMVLISASGMLTGGRILHHLLHRVQHAENTVLFVGFQAPGGRGDWMKSGAKTMRLLGEEVPIRAQIREISGLSAHADKRELLRWAKSCQGTPGQVAVVHGEPEGALALKKSLEQELGWNTMIPKFQEHIVL